MMIKRGFGETKSGVHGREDVRKAGPAAGDMAEEWICPEIAIPT